MPGILLAQTVAASFIVELLPGGLLSKHQDQVGMHSADQSILKETPMASSLQETQFPFSISHLPAQRDTSSVG